MYLFLGISLIYFIISDVNNIFNKIINLGSSIFILTFLFYILWGFNYKRITIKDKLNIPKSEMKQVGKIFNKAKEESIGFEPYAEQISTMFRGNQNVLEEVINILFYVAEADGEVSSSEEKMIEEIAKIFGIEQHQYQSIKESRKSSDKVNPYIV